MSQAQNNLEKVYDLVFYWSVTLTCNFRCPQCTGTAVKLEGKHAPEKIEIANLKKFLKNLDKTAKFIFSGGEPFLVKNIIPAFVEITKKHYLCIITNLVNDQVKKFAKKIDPERVVFIKASAHLLELERFKLFNQFFTNYRLLKEKGYPVDNVAEVAYPFIMDKVDDYKKIFADQGINLEFQAFRGTWQNKTYPDAYTEEEKRFFNLNNEIEAHRTDIYQHQGELCNAGFNVAVIDTFGEIFPCFGVWNSMGNVNKSFSFHDSLMTCPLEHCNCPVQIFDPYLYQKALQRTNPG